MKKLDQIYTHQDHSSSQVKVIQELNEKFKGQAFLIGSTHQSPTLNNQGSLEVSEEIQNLAKSKQYKINDLHGLLLKDIQWNKEPLNIPFATTRFDTIQALRSQGHKPPIISAGSILCSKDREVIVLHQRSPHVVTYPSSWHIVGGGLTPSLSGPNETLEETVIREVYEETAGVIKQNIQVNLVPFTISTEVTTGFIQFTKLALNINFEENKNLKDNEEGDINEISFSSLKEALLEKAKWVPSGQMLVLWWLSQGAPIDDGVSAFKDSTEPLKIYQEVMREDLSHCWKRS